MDGFEKSIKLHAGIFEFKKADLIDFRGTSGINLKIFQGSLWVVL